MTCFSALESIHYHPLYPTNNSGKSKHIFFLFSQEIQSSNRHCRRIKVGHFVSQLLMMLHFVLALHHKLEPQSFCFLHVKATTNTLWINEFTEQYKTNEILRNVQDWNKSTPVLFFKSIAYPCNWSLRELSSWCYLAAVNTVWYPK